MQLFSPRNFQVGFVLAAGGIFSAAHRCMADTITVLTASVPTITFSPASDTLSLNAGSGTFDSTAGPFTFQAGDFLVGDSEISDQNIEFSFDDQVTLNGITKDLTISGQDSVTTAADVLTIYASGPVAFGDELFWLNSFSATGYNIGEDLPIEFQAVVTPEPASVVTPEPAGLLLAGTGVVGLAALARRKRRVIRQS